MRRACAVGERVEAKFIHWDPPADLLRQERERTGEHMLTAAEWIAGTVLAVDGAVNRRLDGTVDQVLTVEFDRAIGVHALHADQLRLAEE